MLRTYLAAYTTPLTDKTGYRWVWRHQKIPDQLLGAFYSKIKKPTDVARWSANELHGGLASVDSEWCAAYRFLDAGRDALGRQGRVFLIAGFFRSNELPQLDLRGILESPLFCTPLDIPPQRMEIDLPTVTTRCPDDLLRKLRAHSTVEVDGVECVNQLAAACAELANRSDFSLQVNGEPARLICALSVSPSTAIEPKPLPLPNPTTKPTADAKPNGPNHLSVNWMLVVIAGVAGLIVGGALGYRFGSRQSQRPIEVFPPPIPEYQSEVGESPASKSKIPVPIPVERPPNPIQRPPKLQHQPVDQ